MNELINILSKQIALYYSLFNEKKPLYNNLMLININEKIDLKEIENLIKNNYMEISDMVRKASKKDIFFKINKIIEENVYDILGKLVDLYQDNNFHLILINIDDNMNTSELEFLIKKISNVHEVNRVLDNEFKEMRFFEIEKAYQKILEKIGKNQEKYYKEYKNLIIIFSDKIKHLDFETKALAFQSIIL